MTTSQTLYKIQKKFLKSKVEKGEDTINLLGSYTTCLCEFKISYYKSNL